MVSQYLPKCTHCGTYALPVCECGLVAYRKLTIDGKEIYTTFADSLDDFILVRAYFNSKDQIVKTVTAPNIFSGKTSYIKGSI